MEAILWFAVAALFLGMVLGFLVWAINTAPFIPAQFKAVAVWVLLVLGILILLIAAWNAISGGGAGPLTMPRMR